MEIELSIFVTLYNFRLIPNQNWAAYISALPSPPFIISIPVDKVLALIKVMKDKLKGS